MREIESTRESLSFLKFDFPLSDELLGRPPFRFIHDIFTKLMEQTGFGFGLFNDEDLDARAAGKAKASKLNWLKTLINAVGVSVGCNMNHISPIKIAAGKNVGNTLFLIRMMCRAGKENLASQKWASDLQNLRQGARSMDNKEKTFFNRRSSNIEIKKNTTKKQKLRVGLTKVHLDLVSNTQLLSSTRHLRYEEANHHHETLITHHVFQQMIFQAKQEKFQQKKKDSNNKKGFIPTNRRTSDPIFTKTNFTDSNDIDSSICLEFQKYIDRLYLFGVPASECYVERIPKTILETFSELTVLSLVNLGLKNGSFSKIDSLPSNLLVLALSENKLEYLPNCFRSIPNLNELRVDRNQIYDLDCDGFPNLVKLVASENCLSNFPRNMVKTCTQLRFLDLNFNEITNPLEDDGNYLQKLEYFGFEHNPTMPISIPPPKTLPFPTILLNNNNNNDNNVKILVENKDKKQQHQEEEKEEEKLEQSDSDDQCLTIEDCKILDLRCEKNISNQLCRDNKCIHFVVVMENQIHIHFEWEENGKKQLKFSPALDLLISLPQLTTIFVQTSENFPLVPIENLTIKGCQPLEKDQPQKSSKHLEKLFHELSIGFHIINCEILHNQLIYKLVVLPRH